MASLEVVEHGDVAAVAELADEWRELHDRSGETNPFLRSEWPVTWLEHFAAPGRDEPYVLSVCSGGRLVAVAPLHRHIALRGRARVIAPIGIGDPWVMPYKLPAILAEPDQGKAAGRALAGHLCEHGDQWDIARLMLGSTNPWLEPEWLPDEFSLLTRRLRATVVVPLDGERDLYAGRRNLKESFRRARNRLTRDFGAEGWSVPRLDEPADVIEGFDALVALHGERAQMRGGRPVHPDAVGDAATLGYLRDVVARLAEQKAARVYQLRIGTEVAASQLILTTSSASYCSLSGASEAAWPYSAVTYLQSRAVEDARADGHRQLILSTGPNQTKLRWTDTVEYHPEYWIVGPRRRSQLLYLATETRNVWASLREAREAHRR